MPERRIALWAAMVLLATSTARAGEQAALVPANAYSVVRPADNPLVKPAAKVPAPTIVWEKIAVRPSHPRLLLTSDRKQAIRKRIEDDPLYEVLKEQAKAGEPMACAFLYQLGGDRATAQPGIQALLAGRVNPTDAPYVYDWTYEAMTNAQRRDATERLWAMVALDRASGWPRCSLFTSYPDDPRPSETPPERWAPFYNWTFHDQDWCRIQAASFAALAALAGHKPRAEEGVRNYWEYSLKDPALFFDHLRDGSYWQGYYWWITNKGELIVRMFDIMRSACGVDYLDPKTHPYLGNLGRWVLYCSDPWRKRVIYNYGDGEMVPTDMRVRRAVAASNFFSRDPYVQWFLQTACPPARNWLPEFLYHDPTLEPIQPKAPLLPPSRAFPGTGLAVLRTRWQANAVWAAVRWADWFDMHVHGDVGSFTLYCKSPLVPDTGFYCRGALHQSNYYHRTVAHNTITVRDPAARIPLNDGCQRLRDKRTWSFAVGTAAWVYNQDDFDRGDLLAFEHQKLYDYCAGDATRAYQPDHLKEFTRQCVLLRDDVLVIFDRVETTRPQLEKRWLMHLVGEPTVDGKLLSTQVKGHIEDYDGSLTISRGTGGAILRCHTLLPAQRLIRRIGGAIPKIPISALVRVPRTRHRMGTGSRWLWTDPLILDYKDPITGKNLPALCFERDSPTDVEYEVSDTDLYMKLDAFERARTVELRLKLADFPTILELARELGKRDIWHLPVHYMPGYEYYNEGMNYAPSYRRNPWNAPGEIAPELLGGPNEQGGWRIEVYPTKPAARDYFLHVIRVQTTEKAETGSVKLHDAADRAEVVVVLAGRTYTLSFAKTGDVGGRIRVVDAQGKLLANRQFATKIVQDDWPTK